MPQGIPRFLHGGTPRRRLTSSFAFAIILAERLYCVHSQVRILQVEQCSLDESRAIRVKGFQKWPQLNRPFYDSRRVRYGRPVFSDITLSVAMFWGFWEWVPVVPDAPKAPAKVEVKPENMTNASNASNASNFTLMIKKPFLSGHSHEFHHAHNSTNGSNASNAMNASNASNASNFTGYVAPVEAKVQYHWVFRRNWAFGSFAEHEKEIPYVLASSNSSYVFAANQAWSERARWTGPAQTVTMPSINCVAAACFEAPREFCQERNREPCGGDESHTCGRCVAGFAGEDGGSLWPCSKEGTAGLTVNFQEHLCNFLRLQGFEKQAWMNNRQLTRRPFAVSGMQTWTSPETSSVGIAVYFCRKLDAWAIAMMEPKQKAGSFAEQIAEIGRSGECPYVAFLGLPHPSMPGGWTETYPISANITLGIEADLGFAQTVSARMTCHAIGDGENPEWKGRCPTCTIMPTWWFCDGGCEALSLVGIVLILIFLMLLCAKCRFCLHTCWHVDEHERERQVKLGLMDCKDERAPHHMRIAKTGDQRVAVKFFGTAHPDHTVKGQQIRAMKEQNKQRAETRRAHEIEGQLKKMQRPPITARLKWWARDAFAEPDTSRQRVHPMMLQPERPEVRSPTSSPKSLRNSALSDPDADAPPQPVMMQRLDTSSWREPDKRHAALPDECSANKEAALDAARNYRFPQHGRKSAFSRAQVGRSSTLRSLADSHQPRPSLGALKALTNG